MDRESLRAAYLAAIDGPLGLEDLAAALGVSARTLYSATRDLPRRPRGRSRRLSADESARIVDLYRVHSLADVHAITGRSRQVILAVLKRAGVDTRARGTVGRRELATSRPTRNSDMDTTAAAHGTGIEWTRTPGTVGDTWDPLGGCTPEGPECANCWAARLVGTRLAKIERFRGLAVVDAHSRVPKWTGEVRLYPELLRLPLRRSGTGPRVTYFACSRSDFLHESIPIETSATIVRVALQSIAVHRSRVIFLTKRHHRLGDLARHVWRDAGREVEVEGVGKLPPLPPLAELRSSIAIGLSIGQPRAAHKIRALDDVRRWAMPILSIEPLIERLSPGIADVARQVGVEWALLGGESGPRSRCRGCPIDGPGGLVELGVAFHRVGIPPYVKQLGAVPLFDVPHAGPPTDPRWSSPDHWPQRVRDVGRWWPRCWRP